jgi:hypothetical protein
LDDIIADLEAESLSTHRGQGNGSADCISLNGIALSGGDVASTKGVEALMFWGGRDEGSAKQRAAAAAEAEAARNAGGGAAAGYQVRVRIRG